MASARIAIETDQPAQQGMLVEESRLSPLRPLSQFVFLAACGTRPSCSRWMAASARTVEASRYWTASGRSLAADMVTAHVGAVGGVQRSEAYSRPRLDVLCLQQDASTKQALQSPECYGVHPRMNAETGLRRGLERGCRRHAVLLLIASRITTRTRQEHT